MSRSSAGGPASEQQLRLVSSSGTENQHGLQIQSQLCKVLRH